MNKLVAALIAVFVLLSAFAPALAEAPIVFHDDRLEMIVRKHLSKPEGDITAADAESLLELDIGNHDENTADEDRVHDISALRHFPNLFKFTAFNNAISDISPLEGLTGLKILDLGGNAVSDIGPLKGLSELYEVALWGNAIRDVSPLAGLKNLRSLRLCGNPVDDWSALSDIHAALEDSDFDPAWRGESDPVAFDDAALEAKVRAQIGKPEGAVIFGDVQSVEELNLGNEHTSPEHDKVRSIEALRSFPNLRKLEAWNNDIRDLGPLADIPGLFILNVDGNPVERLEPLAGLSDLAAVSAVNCRIEDVAPLAGLVNLQSLRLSGNPIADFSPLAGIVDNLDDRDFEVLVADGVPDEPIEIAEPAFEAALRRAMDIHDRPITQKDAFLTRSLVLHNEKTEESSFSDLDALKWFVNLESLEFNSNPITDLRPLAGLAKLKHLNVSFCPVADLSPLAGLENLETLNLRNCRIADVRPLAGLPSLRWVDLAENPIEDMSPLDGMPDLYIEF